MNWRSFFARIQKFVESCIERERKKHRRIRSINQKFVVHVIKFNDHLNKIYELQYLNAFFFLVIFWLNISTTAHDLFFQILENYFERKMLFYSNEYFSYWIILKLNYTYDILLDYFRDRTTSIAAFFFSPHSQTYKSTWKSLNVKGKKGTFFSLPHCYTVYWQ